MRKIKALIYTGVFSKLGNWKLNFCCDTCSAASKDLWGIIMTQDGTNSNSTILETKSGK